MLVTYCYKFVTYEVFFIMSCDFHVEIYVPLNNVFYRFIQYVSFDRSILLTYYFNGLKLIVYQIDFTRKFTDFCPIYLIGCKSRKIALGFVTQGLDS